MALTLDTPLSGPCSRAEAFDKILIPQATRTYQPLSNEDFVSMIYRVAAMHGVVLENEQFGLDLKGQRFFGVCDVIGKDFFGDTVQLTIGFCNSGNGSMAARFCIGGKVFVCSNRCFWSYTDEKTGIDGTVIRPHKNLDNEGIHNGLFTQVNMSFQKLDDFRASQEKFYEGLSCRQIDDNTAYATIVRAAQAGVINKTKMLTLADEWNKQSIETGGTKDYEWHEEFMPRNAYSLFNAFTQVRKKKLKDNPVQSNISSFGLTKFFQSEFNLD